jgi:hypothetical protein
MQADNPDQLSPSQICRVTAHVSLVPDIRHSRAAGDELNLPHWLTSPQHDDLPLSVLLSAEVQPGRQVDARTPFGIAGPRRGAGAAWCRYHPACSRGPGSYHVCALDISESINQMLGRDPALHRPPRLAWQSLLAALRAVNLYVTVEQLNEVPFFVILDDDVEVELARIAQGI